MTSLHHGRCIAPKRLRLFLIACAAVCWGAVVPAAWSGIDTLEEKENYERDRQAILAMAGNYHVQFSFRETATFAEDYQLKEPYDPDGYETVRVIRDDGNVISLQHILVSQGMWGDPEPIKHWRQDWIYEPEQIFEYAGHRVWRTRPVSEDERLGKWAQLVYEVDDGPRYGAVGEWIHRHGISEWTSPPTWRPLPRREATKRNDYDVLVSVNRHALTPRGWVHEQDSTKLVLGEDPHSLAREVGVNTYTATNDFNVHVAEEYWNQTRRFWAEVRAEWAQLLQGPGTIRIKSRGESGKLYNQILNLANEARAGKRELLAAAAHAVDLIHGATTTELAEGEPRQNGREQRAEYRR